VLCWKEETESVFPSYLPYNLDKYLGLSELCPREATEIVFSSYPFYNLDKYSGLSELCLRKGKQIKISELPPYNLDKYSGLSELCLGEVTLPFFRSQQSYSKLLIYFGEEDAHHNNESMKILTSYSM
jgi:hypothetical protein